MVAVATGGCSNNGFYGLLLCGVMTERGELAQGALLDTHSQAGGLEESGGQKTY